MSRFSRATTASVAAVALMLLTACATESTPSALPDEVTVSVSSAYGDVEVPVAAERVAAVSYDTPWQLKSLGIQPIATIDYSQWLDSYSTEQQHFIADAAVVGTFGEVNLEALAASAPDLIIGDSSEIDEVTFQQLQSIAPTVIVGGADRGDWQTQTEQTAAATGTTEVWQREKAAYESLRDTTTAAYADIIAANTWINFSFGDESGQFSIQLPSGSTGDLVVNELGLEYGVGAQLEDADARGYVSLSLEQLPSAFEGVTFALTFAQPTGDLYPALQEIIDSELFQALPVAQSGSIYGMRTVVTDYTAAQAWITELTENVLVPLGG